MRRIYSLAVGVVLGVVVASTIGAAQDRGRSTRLEFIGGERNSATSELVFIKDPKSGGCWLGVDAKGQGITSLAPALAEACR